MPTTDFYAVLDVTADASRDEIKRAYRRQQRLTHPDTGGDADAFRAVTEAWETLGDESKRAAYDRARDRASYINTGGSDNPTYFSTGASMRTDTFNEEMSNRIKTEATRLFEEVRRRQQADAAREQEIEDLGSPTFPLYSSSLGANINRLYVEGRMWNIPYATLKHWKTLDVWLIRAFLFVLIVGDIAWLALTYVGSPAENLTNAILQTIMYAAFLDLVALLFAFITGGAIAIYRFTKHGLRRRGSPTFKL